VPPMTTAMATAKKRPAKAPVVKLAEAAIADLDALDRRISSLFSTCCAHEGRMTALENALAQLAAATVKAPPAAPPCRVLVTSRFKKT
jgi:hypothetical protein